MVYRVPGHTKFLLVWLLSGIAVASCGPGQNQPVVVSYYDAAKISIQRKSGISYLNGKILNGIVFSVSEKGDTLMKAPYLDGKENGEFVYRYTNGELNEVRIFVNGKKEGKHSGWYENGKLRFEYNYTKDEFDGEYKEWYTNGQLFRNLNFKNGHEDGRQEVWFEGGQVKSNYIIKNGRRYGLLGTKNCVNVADSVRR